MHVAALPHRPARGNLPAILSSLADIRRRLMTVVTLPPDLDTAVQAVARRHGKAAEQLVIAALRARFTPIAAPPPPQTQPPLPGDLAGFLEGFAGTVAGSVEPLSERCGERFAEGLVNGAGRAQSA
jgi:hypothetical protein